MNSVCIYDFFGRAGPFYPVQMFADWFPETKLTIFGGAWWHIPDMPSETEPTQAEVQAWVTKHDPRSTEDMIRGYAAKEE